MNYNKYGQPGDAKIEESHNKHAAYSRPPQQEERIEYAGKDASRKGAVRQVLAFLNYLRSGTKHADTEPDNHTTTKYTQNELHNGILEELGEAKVY